MRIRDVIFFVLVLVLSKRFFFIAPIIVAHLEFTTKGKSAFSSCPFNWTVVRENRYLKRSSAVLLFGQYYVILFLGFRASHQLIFIGTLVNPSQHHGENYIKKKVLNLLQLYRFSQKKFLGILIFFAFMSIQFIRSIFAKNHWHGRRLRGLDRR